MAIIWNPQVRATVNQLLVCGYVALISLSLACAPTPGTPGEAIALMEKYQSQGRYDDALKVGLEWLEEYPEDGVVHAQTARIYLQKARTHPSERETLVAEAVRLAHRAVELEPGHLTMMRLAIAAFESAGDIADVGQCKHYRNALHLIDTTMRYMDDYSRRRAVFEYTEGRSELAYRQKLIDEKAKRLGCET